MTQILSIITFLALLFYTATEVKFQLQMMQQNTYRNDRYNRWLKGESFASVSRLVDLFLLLLLSTNFLPLFVQIVAITVRPDHHGHGVPSHPCSQPCLIGHIAGRALFTIGGNSIDIGRIAGKGKIDALLPGDIGHALHQIMRPFRPFVFDHGMQCFYPFRCFLLIRILVVNENIILLIRHKLLPVSRNGTKTEKSKPLKK